METFLSFPSIKTENDGLLELGDYCDGDLLLCARGNTAVYENGKWIYSEQEWARDQGTETRQILNKTEFGDSLCIEAYNWGDKNIYGTIKITK